MPASEQPPLTARHMLRHRLALPLWCSLLILGVAGASAWYCWQLKTQLGQQYQQLDTQLKQQQQYLNTIEASLAQQQRELHTQQVLLANYTGSTASQISHAQALIAQANAYFSLGGKAALVLGLLQQAQLILNNNNDAKVSAVKQAIAVDINALQAMSWPNMATLHQQLLTLERQIWHSPLRHLTPQASNNQLPPHSTWQQWLATTLQNLIVIQRLPLNSKQPALNPAALIAIKQHLLALINLSIWATLYRDQQIYNFSLAAIKQQLSTAANNYFDTTMLLAKVEALAAIKLNPAATLQLQAPAAIAQLQPE